MMPKKEIYKVVVPIPCNPESEKFYKEVKKIFFGRTKDVSLEVSSLCKIHQVEVLYRFPLDGDPLIPVEIEASEIFKNLTEFGEFLEKAAV